MQLLIGIQHIVLSHATSQVTLKFCRYKFYSDSATNISGYFWKWPYIDICFYGDNGTHLYDMDPSFSQVFVYDKKDIFPLTSRPFGALKLKVPRHTETVIKQNYDIDLCQTRQYDHRRQKSLHQRNVTTVSCSLLYRLFPFVFRDEGREVLKLDGSPVL